MGEIPDIAGHSAAAANARAPIVSLPDAGALATAIIESCSEAIVPTLFDGAIIGWNAAATELLGYSADEMIGQHWRRLVPADHIGEVARAGRRVAQGEKCSRIATVVRCKDGHEIEALCVVSALRDGAGTLIGCSTIFRDITEDRRTEKRRHLNEEKFRTVFKHSSDSISLGLMPDGRYLDVNDEFC